MNLPYWENFRAVFQFFLNVRMIYQVWHGFSFPKEKKSLKKARNMQKIIIFARKLSIDNENKGNCKRP